MKRELRPDDLVMAFRDKFRKVSDSMSTAHQSDRGFHQSDGESDIPRNSVVRPSIEAANFIRRPLDGGEGNHKRQIDEFSGGSEEFF